MSETLRYAIRDGNLIAAGRRSIRAAEREAYCDCGGVRSLTPCTADCAWRRK